MIDLDVLAGLRGLQQPDQPDFVTELIDLFLNDSASQAAILRAAIASNDMPEVRRVAHLMKGSSANLGATHMAELYQELETLALGIRAAGTDGQTVLVKLEDEFHHVSEALKAQRQQFEKVMQ
jgi:HPt (histidine-containing phosphotransfer) domain-containing protein